MSKILISASILSADFANLGEQIRSAEAGGVDWIHIDVMDGSFVPNITMGPFIIETCRRITQLPLDVHLMIDHPDRHLEDFARAGASNLTVHIENTPHIYKTLETIKYLGCHASIALNPGTPASHIESIIPLLDMVLVMTVNPGYSGQEYIPGMVAKVRQVYALLKSHHSNARIEVDGGISEETLPEVFEAGANTIVSATAIFKHPGGIAAGVQALRRKVD
ncbi:MAG TPA: ribulose-phosphate 3-epimerase [Anaerolineaceae bacterium]|nr:ribulose-phosphate 3-epimerase [Anaerolineaceae bacterium]